jgi:succinate dehydrogenase / fumarate reductase cytochrome b subunit
MFAGWITTPIGKLLLLGWSFCLFFHLSNGIRHLFWDAGLGFEKKQSDRSAWLVLVVTIVCTVGYWMTVAGGLS